MFHNRFYPYVPFDEDATKAAAKVTARAQAGTESAAKVAARTEDSHRRLQGNEKDRMSDEKDRIHREKVERHREMLETRKKFLKQKLEEFDKLPPADAPAGPPGQLPPIGTAGFDLYMALAYGTPSRTTDRSVDRASSLKPRTGSNDDTEETPPTKKPKIDDGLTEK